jgi:hypothetical protein
MSIYIFVLTGMYCEKKQQQEGTVITNTRTFMQGDQSYTQKVKRHTHEANLFLVHRFYFSF